MNKIATDVQETGILEKELDQLKIENGAAEEEQAKCMELIVVTERDVATANHELADLRANCSTIDMANLGLRKEIEV